MLTPIDIILRTVAVMAAVLLAGLLLTSARQRPAAIPGALFCLAVAAFFTTSIPGGGAALGPPGYGLTAICVTKAVWFWLFARALFNDDARLVTGHLAIAGADPIALHQRSASVTHLTDAIHAVVRIRKATSSGIDR